MTDNDPTILDHPEYRESLARLEEAIREHLRVIEAFGNEHDTNDTGIPEQSIVAGWVLILGQVGFAEGREFHTALVETPDSINGFHAIGLVDYARRFLAYQTADYEFEE